VRKRAAILGFLLALAAGRAVRGAETSGPYRLEAVRPGVFAAIARSDGSAAARNAGFVVGSRAVLAVDEGASPERARDLLAAIRGRTLLPVRWLVVSSDRPGDRAAIGAFAEAGAVEVAAESPVRRPGIAYRERVTIWLGGRKVEVFSCPGRAAATSLVWAPDAGVLFTGDFVWRKTFPDVSGARMEVWIRALDGLLLDYPGATFVPGRGEVATALDVRQFRDYLSTLRLAVARALRQGKSGDALIESVRPSLLVRFSGWSGREAVDRNIADAQADLTATKRPAPPRAP
jgi:cyclase